MFLSLERKEAQWHYNTISNHTCPSEIIHCSNIKPWYLYIRYAKYVIVTYCCDLFRYLFIYILVVDLLYITILNYNTIPLQTEFISKYFISKFQSIF